MNRRTLFFILFSCVLLALTDAHFHHHNHRKYHTVTETSTNTVTVTTTSSTCESTPTDNLSCPLNSQAKKRHNHYNYHHGHHNHHNHHNHSYKKTVTCTPTTTLCATPTPQCIPDGQPVQSNSNNVELC